MVIVHLVFGISFGDIGVGDGVFICMRMSPPQGEVFFYLSIHLSSECQRGGSGGMALIRKNLTLDELVTAGFLSQDMIGQNHVCEVKHF